MKKLILVFCLYVLGACSALKISNSESCILDFEIDQTDYDCNSWPSNPDCEHIDIGFKGLSNTAKEDFSDFCYDLDSDILFKSSENDILYAKVIRKEYKVGRAIVLTHPTLPDCKRYCLDNESAFLIIDSERFKIKLELRSKIAHDNTINDANAYEKIEISFAMYAFHKNTFQLIFNLPIEGYMNAPITDSNAKSKYHKTIELDGIIYYDLFSNETYNPYGLKRKERVYFHPKDGLIAVRDSLGILWSKR